MLGCIIDFCFFLFLYEIEGDGLIFFFNILCELSIRFYFVGIICRIIVLLFSNMMYILVEIKFCFCSMFGGF